MVNHTYQKHFWTFDIVNEQDCNQYQELMSFVKQCEGVLNFNIIRNLSIVDDTFCKFPYMELHCTITTGEVDYKQKLHLTTHEVDTNAQHMGESWSGSWIYKFDTPSHLLVLIILPSLVYSVYRPAGKIPKISFQKLLVIVIILY